MTDPAQLPPPDLLDSAGRMKRLVIALMIGAAAAAAAYFLADSLAHPDELRGGLYGGGQRSRGYQFVYYVTGLAGAACFTIALVVQNHFAKKKWRAEQVPQARAIDRS
jgi:hypothetical protein